MYIATKYIGKKYTPGEILPDNLPADEVKWLLEAGAIRKTAPDPEAPVMADAPVDNGQAAQAPDPEPDEQEAEVSEAEIDEEAEAPEIDVMDGIVSSAKKSQPKETARKTTSKGRKKA